MVWTFVLGAIHHTLNRMPGKLTPKRNPLTKPTPIHRPIPGARTNGSRLKRITPFVLIP
jgi:hypothetical protein